MVQPVGGVNLYLRLVSRTFKDVALLLSVSGWVLALTFFRLIGYLGMSAAFPFGFNMSAGCQEKAEI
jgi:hypothetical protein